MGGGALFYTEWSEEITSEQRSGKKKKRYKQRKSPLDSENIKVLRQEQQTGHKAPETDSGRSQGLSPIVV